MHYSGPLYDSLLLNNRHKLAFYKSKSINKHDIDVFRILSMPTYRLYRASIFSIFFLIDSLFPISIENLTIPQETEMLHSTATVKNHRYDGNIRT